MIKFRKLNYSYNTGVYFPYKISVYFLTKISHYMYSRTVVMLLSPFTETSHPENGREKNWGYSNNTDCSYDFKIKFLFFFKLTGVWKVILSAEDYDIYVVFLLFDLRQRLEVWSPRKSWFRCPSQQCLYQFWILFTDNYFNFTFTVSTGIGNPL